MARIDKGATDQEVLEKELSRLDERLKSNGARIFSCFNCLIYFLVIILVFAGFVCYWLALSGVANIPFLSDRYYTEPKPIYYVEPQPIISTNDFISKMLTSSVQNFLNGQQAKTKSEISISEGQLTGLLQHVLLTKGSRIKLAQVSLHDGMMDIFFQTDGGVVANLLTKPYVKNSNVRFESQNFKVGQLKLPDFFAGIVSGMILDSSIGTLQKTLGGFGEATDVKINSGKLIIGIE